MLSDFQRRFVIRQKGVKERFATLLGLSGYHKGKVNQLFRSIS